MRLLISPAKTLDYTSAVPPAVAARATAPLFNDQAAALIALLRKKSVRQVSQMMDLSEALSTLNVQRYADWRPEATDTNSKPAVLAFDGDVYDGLQARTLGLDDLEWAQQHLVILSGLYGVLRPLDRLQPYRLEMGTALKTRRGKDLYAWWGARITDWLNAQQAAEAAPVIVNLASIEYSRAALRRGLRARVVDCVFEDFKGADYKIISFFAKKARGLMARHAILKRATAPEQLLDFNAEGYAFVADASTDARYVFRRRVEAAV